MNYEFLKIFLDVKIAAFPFLDNCKFNVFQYIALFCPLERRITQTGELEIEIDLNWFLYR